METLSDDQAVTWGGGGGFLYGKAWDAFEKFEIST